jgi:hypothetical protein
MKTSIQRDIIESGKFPDCDYVIEATDSTNWRLGTKDPRLRAAFCNICQR